MLNFKDLKKREKGILIIFICVIIVSGYYNLSYKPLERNINTYKLQNEKLAARAAEVRAKFPQIDKQKSNLETLNKEYDGLLEEISAIEEELPAKKSVSNLIGELTRLAKGFKLTSIRKRVDEGEDYSRIYIELKFNAAYQETIDYISNLETISPFLKIEELEISQVQRKSAKEKEQATPVRIVLTSLLVETVLGEQLRAKEVKEQSPVARDIFVSKTKPVVPIRKSQLKLEGITYEQQFPTAIINGEVVKIGSVVEEYEVKEILSDRVVVAAGAEEHVLYVER